MKIFFFCCILLCTLTTACMPKQQAQAGAETKASFALPEIPPILTTQEARLNYLTQHYWDHFDFQDSANLYSPEGTEQALVNYMDLLKGQDSQTTDTCVTAMLQKAAALPAMVHYFVEILHDYWMQPHSPLYKEAYYEPVARFVLSSSLFDEVAQSTAAFELKMIGMNSVGSKANDFEFVSDIGTAQLLSQIDARHLILFFYDPDCDQCHQVQEQLSSLQPLNALIEGGEVKLLAIYPFSEYSTWRNYQTFLPSTWLNGYNRDGSIGDIPLYNLIHMPAIYLLDSRKIVLRKDASIAELAEYLEQLR